MFRVGIIGIGSISEGYGTPEDPYAYCHTGGILYSDRVRLTAVADLAPERRERFRVKWGHCFPDLKYYDSAAAMLSGESLHIVAVCVRGPHHFSVMMETLAAGPRAVFLEKPPTCSLAEMDTMMAAARVKNIPVTVSYSRHWAPHVLRLQQLVRDEGLIGEVHTVIGYVGGSVLSFASHTTDLICQFAGYCPEWAVAQGRYTDVGNVPESYEPEPSLNGAIIGFRNGVTGLHVGADTQFGGFYCEAIGTEGGVRAGLYLPAAAWDQKKQPINLNRYGMPVNQSVFTVAYGQIADYLEGGPLPHCTDADFVAVHETGFAIIESLRSGKRESIPVSDRTRKVFANG
ncbi:MAG: Gfo/Idh/MocA family oxidoreductase [candidate division Zixibacteria bacterium]|nr:Gfo/Idh/MocA family oxidoreductase [candidate division Zixibacteria bacterium]